MTEEAVMGTDQGEDREEGAGVWGSAGSDEIETKTQENLTPTRLDYRRWNWKDARRAYSAG